ncbi:MAG: ankyrin repeat domain-containing protein [Candidatus Eisenbacteria bacterium]
MYALFAVMAACAPSCGGLARTPQPGVTGTARQVLTASGSNADLIRFIREGDTANVRQVLEGGRDPDAQGYAGELPLVVAASTRDRACVRLLLAHGAHADASDLFDVTPLMRAAESGDAQLVTDLLGLGANPNHVIRSTPPVTASEVGYTPLFFACRGGSLPIVAALVQKGADVNHILVQGELGMGDDGMTPTLMAAESGHAEIVEFLQQQGAREDARKRDEALLRGAALRDDSTRVRELLAKGVPVDARGTKRIQGTTLILRTPLLMAIDSRVRGDRPASIAVARLLIAAGADINDVGLGDSPLAIAVEQRQVETVRFLVSAGADPRRKGRDSESALQLARRGVKQGWYGMSPILAILEHGR